MNEKKLTEDKPAEQHTSTESLDLGILADNQDLHFSTLATLLARNMAWTMTCVNLQKNVLVNMGAPLDEIEAHISGTYKLWYSVLLDDVEKIIDQVSRYEGLDEQNP